MSEILLTLTEKTELNPDMQAKKQHKMWLFRVNRAENNEATEVEATCNNCNIVTL